jgi:hypothetical protein
MTRKLPWRGRWHALTAEGRVGRRCEAPGLPTTTQGVLHCEDMHGWTSTTWRDHAPDEDGTPVRVTREARAQRGTGGRSAADGRPVRLRGHARYRYASSMARAASAPAVTVRDRPSARTRT